MMAGSLGICAWAARRSVKTISKPVEKLLTTMILTGLAAITISAGQLPARGCRRPPTGSTARTRPCTKPSAAAARASRSLRMRPQYVHNHIKPPCFPTFGVFFAPHFRCTGVIPDWTFFLLCGIFRKSPARPGCFRAIPHNSARANPEKNWVLMKAVFRRNTLCISRKSDKIRAQFFREAPKPDCAVLP